MCEAKATPEQAGLFDEAAARAMGRSRQIQKGDLTATRTTAARSSTPSTPAPATASPATAACPSGTKGTAGRKNAKGRIAYNKPRGRIGRRISKLKEPVENGTFCVLATDDLADLGNEDAIPDSDDEVLEEAAEVVDPEQPEEWNVLLPMGALEQWDDGDLATHVRQMARQPPPPRRARPRR